MKTVKICGIPHEIEEMPVVNEEGEGITQGQIIYSEAKIQIKESLPQEVKDEVLIHEIVHGILQHIGEVDLCADERFVQALASGIYNSGLLLQIEEG
jgi:predicted metal-dependent peptidase